MSENTKYTGKTVLLERTEPTKDHSGYYDGEYLIYQETDNQLFGIPLGSGLSVYGLQAHRGSLPLKGNARYTVVSVGEPRPWMLHALDRVDEEIRQVRAGEKKASWVLSVYDNAESISGMLRDVLERTPDNASAAQDEVSGPAVRQMKLPLSVAGVHVQTRFGHNLSVQYMGDVSGLVVPRNVTSITINGDGTIVWAEA